MAGKSTIMRSTIAVALLGSCGLFGPARAARVPYIDAFMLRTFSADAPTEGRSSFAVEMVEMRRAPAPVSPRLLPCSVLQLLHEPLHVWLDQATLPSTLSRRLSLSSRPPHCGHRRYGSVTDAGE